MKRRTRRKIVWIVLLLLLLAFLSMWYVNFRATRSLSLDLRRPNEQALEPPRFLYAFTGPESTPLLEPIGVLADGGNVYVADGKGGQIFVFGEDGSFVRTFGKGKVQVPLYIAKNPKDGNLYITDRRLRQVLMFKTDGTYVGVFDPKLPKNEQPDFDTKGDAWVPVALTFADDGRMYVLEHLGGHRMLIFNADGSFKKSVGSTGIVKTANELPGLFQFPNSIKIRNKLVYIADSNNRRVQVFDMDGTFKSIIFATGLPRGVAFLPRPANATSETVDKFVVVDTLSHDATVFGSDGERMLVFGNQGVGPGEFNYPGDVSVGTRSLIFVTDTMNLRVQAWGWNEQISPIPHVLPREPAWYLALLPLGLIPLFRRKKRFYATEDFVLAMLDAGLVHKMEHGRRAWFVSQADHDSLKDLREGDIRLGDLLKVMDSSRSDTMAIMDRLEIDEATAATLAGAQRTKLLCTQSVEIRRLARTMELDVCDMKLYMERFGGAGKRSKKSAGTDGSDTGSGG